MPKKINSTSISRRASSHSLHSQTEEPIDWIDARGKKMATLTKRIVHLGGLKHHAVHIFVLNEKNELVLQRRKLDRFLQPGAWDTSVGGHVTSGETLLKSAQREMMEELRVDAALHVLGTIDVLDSQKKYVNDERVTYYWCRTREKPYYQRLEIAGLKWIPLSRVSAFIRTHKCSPMFVAGWKKFGKKIQIVTGVDL